MNRYPRAVAPALALALPFALAAATAAAATPARPAAPLVPRLARPAGAPLDLRMRTEPDFVRSNPGAACGTSRALADAWRAREEARAARPPAAASLLATTYVRDDIVVMENDGKLVVGDRQLDLEGKTLRITPGRPRGFDLAALAPSAYVAPASPALFSDEWSGYRMWSVPLGFSFPFGGTSYTSVEMTNTMGLFMGAGTATGPTDDQVVESTTLYDRTPRIAPLLGGRSYYGYTGYVDTTATSATFTWTAVDRGTTYVEVQVVLTSSGDITMTWNKLGANHGAFAVITGNASFWSADAEVAAWTDPADVAIGKPEETALDGRRVALWRVPGTGVTRFVMDLEGAPPASSANQIYYEFYFFDDASSGTSTGYEWVSVVGGAITGSSMWARLTGTQLEVGIPAWRFRTAGPGFELRTYSWLYDAGWNFGDETRSGLRTISGTRTSPMLDLTVDLALGGQEQPLYEAFTLGELDPGAVLAAYQAAYPGPTLDGMAIFQAFETDIVFYAGAYSTVGNAGANGIGIGSKTDPPAPALLHMNKLGYGWNSWPAGRTTVLDQEFGHHWAYFARIQEGGSTATILNPDGAHPAPWVHTPSLTDVYYTPDFSSFGGTWWTDHGDGTFRSASEWSGSAFWPAELYLMGLLESKEVPDWWYIKDAVPGFGGQIGYWPPADMDQAGTRVPVRIQQMLDENGDRDPGFAEAPHDFRVPFVLIVRPGALLPSDSATTRDYCLEWKPNFFRGSYGRGTVSCLSHCVRPGESVGNTLYEVKGSFPGTVRYLWTDLSGATVDDYVVLEDPSKRGGFGVELGSTTSAGAGLELTPGAGATLFYRVAGRTLPDCIGPK